jgi:hypothetical protein
MRVAKKFNDADAGGRLLSSAVKEINRTPKKNRFAKVIRGR